MKDIDKIATQIMGWEKRKAHFHPSNFEHWFDGDERQILVTSWNPKTNIAHAWEIVEKMIKEDYSFDMGCPYENKEDWWAQFTSDNFAPAETAPLAICKAALKVIEP